MLLVVDVGNTQSHVGLFEGDELTEHWRFHTARTATADELAVSTWPRSCACAAWRWPTSRRWRCPAWCRRWPRSTTS